MKTNLIPFRMRWVFLILFLWISGLTSAQVVNPGGGSGSYRLNYPGWNYAHHLYAPIGDNLTSHIKKGPNYTGPFQTHQWWNSALWDYGNIVVDDGTKNITDLGHEMHSGPMYPYPLFLEAKQEGYILRYGETDINGLNNEVEVHSAVIDARVGLSGQTASETSIDDYGDWHAVFYQNYGSGNTLKMTAAKGCPYAFFQRTGTLNPTIYGLGKDVVMKSTSGNSFIFRVAPEGRNVYFAVFFPAGTKIGNNGAPTTNITALPLGVYGCCWDNMVFGLPAGANYFSVAVMTATDKATLDLYESRAFNFITKTTHSYAFSEAQSKLTTTFAVTTNNVYGGLNNGTLQALMKHQYKYSPEATGALNTGITYKCPRGILKVLATNTFTTVMTHNGILPNLGWANTYNKAQMKAYIDNYLPTIAIPQSPADGYNKDGFVDLANCAQIASQIGYTAAKNRCLDALEQRLTNWFSTNATEDWALFVYSSNFNWLAHYPNGFTSSGQFIDMHFHMAYLIYGAAILARYRPTWANQYKGMVETMIRQIDDYRKDATNPGNIGWFPYLRFFDPYEGHSWADPSATNQESVSESLTFALGTFLWGETIGNNNLRDLGALLYITEAETAKLYWFDVDQDNNYNWGGTTYPQYHVTILRSSGMSYATFFSADDRWKHSIDLIPQTAGSLWQVWDSVQARTIYSHLPPGGYTAWDDHGYNYNFVQAGFNGPAAVTAFNNYAVSEQWINPTFPHVNGDIPILYQWDHTFDSVGVFDNKVQADITGFAVFRKNNCKHYMIYMPPGKGPKTVNFTDGSTFLVPDDTVIVYKQCNKTLPITLVEFNGKAIDEQNVLLHWTTSMEMNNNFFDVERSDDGMHWESIGKVNSKGNSNSITHYSLTDRSPFRAKNYYRLRQVDFNGTFEYSNIILIEYGEEGSKRISIYPNPIADELKIKLPEGSFEFQLYELLGKSYPMNEMESGVDPDRIFNATHLPAGVYFLIIQDLETGERWNFKVRKL